MARAAGSRGIGFNGIVVSANSGYAGIGNPVQQCSVAAIEHGTGALKSLVIGLASHLYDRLRKPGAQHQHVATIDIDFVVFQDV